jgi:hypothetical protein
MSSDRQVIQFPPVSKLCALLQVPTQYVHTLNATAAAVPRLIIAILETHQQADGSVLIPQALQPFMGGQSVISPEDARLLPSVQ